MKNSRKELALAALVTYPTVREAARASNIPERTLWRYLEQDDFSSRLNEEKSKLVASASDRLKSKLDAATQTIASVMANEETPPQVRVNAARTILEFSLRYVEMADVIARLERLEQQTTAGNGV